MNPSTEETASPDAKELLRSQLDTASLFESERDEILRRLVVVERLEGKLRKEAILAQ